MRTSRDLNWPKKIGERFLQRSLFFAFFGIPASVMLSIYLETASSWVFFATIFAPMIVSQMFYGQGKPFPDYNIERFKIWLRKTLRADRFNVDVDYWEGTTMKKIENGIMYGFGNTETYGYKILVDPSQRREAFYQAFFQSILKFVDHGVIIKDAVTSVPFESDYIKTHRPTLITKGICDQSRYLFVTFEETCSKSTKQEILEKLSLGTRRMNDRELVAYMEAVAAPESPASGRPEPTYQVSQRLDGRHIRMYPVDKVQGAISLCSLPSFVDEEYNLILASALNRHSVITTTFKKREGVAESFRTLVDTFFKVAQVTRKKTAEEKLAAEEELDRENRGDKAKLFMYQSILMYDSPEGLQKRFLELQNVRTRLQLSDEKTPIYMADEGFIEQSFKVAMPSPWAYLPQRLQAIKSFEEASYYLPIESKIEGRFSPLMFRTIRNTLRYIDIQDTSDAIMTLIVGGAGTGKSTLLGGLSDAIDYLETIGIATGKVTIDIGTSSGFQEDDENVLSFNLANKDENGDIAPYPVHPLHCALDPQKSEYTVKEKTLARDQLVRLLGLRTSKSIAQGIIMDALDQMVKYRSEYRLSTFRDYFLPLFRGALESSNLTNEVKMEWENSIAMLNKFCASSKVIFGPWPQGVTPPVEYKAGEFSKIFDPELTKYQSLGDFKRLYFNMSLAEETITDLATAHMNFAFLIGYSVCLKYDSESGNYHLFHFYVEEFQKARKYVDPTEFLELKNQLRKNGHLIYVVSQAFEHFILKGLEEKEQQEIFKYIRDIFFGNISFEDDKHVLKTLLTTDKDDFLSEKFEEVKSTISNLQQVYSRRKAAALSDEKSPYIEEALSTYNIGYISPTREVDTLHVDYEPISLWKRTTHGAGRELRNKVMSELGLSRNEAARELLKIYKSVPTSKLSDEEITKTIERIRGGLK